MKVLFVSNMFPTKSHIYYGIHVKEQIDSLVKYKAIESQLYFINALVKGKIEYFKAIFRIKKSVEKFNPDIIHIHYGLAGLFILFFKPKCKVFITLHGGDILPKQKKYVQLYLTKKILKKVDKAFILNDEMAEILSKLDIPFEILPCGVDLDFFKYSENKLFENKTYKTLVFPGDSNRPVKNYPLFQEVINELKELVPSYDFKVKIVHNLERKEVVDLLCLSDCLVMTSFSEGSPQIIKEALCCNLPVVSVNVGDLKEVLEDLPGCFVTKTYTAKEIAEFVIKSLESETDDLRSQFIKKGIYDNKSICDKLYQAYKLNV